MKTKKLLYIFCTLLFSLFVFNINYEAEIHNKTIENVTMVAMALPETSVLPFPTTDGGSTNDSSNSTGGGCSTGEYLGRDGQCYPNSNLSEGGCSTGYYKGRDGQCYPIENKEVTATGDSNPTCDPDPSCWFWNCCSSGSSSSTTSGSGDSSSNLIMCANGICRDGNGNPIVNSTTSGAANNTYRSGPKCGTDGKFTDIGGVCFPNNTGLSNAPIYVILSNILSWLMGLFTTLAILAFVFSGTQYFLSTADEDMAKSAKKNATNAVIGIIIGLSGFVIIRAIAAALQGQSYFF